MNRHHRHSLVQRAIPHHPRLPRAPAQSGGIDNDEDGATTMSTRRPQPSPSPPAAAGSTFDALSQCLRTCLTDKFETTCEGNDVCYCGSPARLRLSAVCIATGCTRPDLATFMDNVNDTCSPSHANSLVSALETATGTKVSVIATSISIAVLPQAKSSKATTPPTTSVSILRTTVIPAETTSTTISPSRALRVTSISTITTAESTLVVQPIADLPNDKSSMDAASTALSGLSKPIVVGLSVAGAVILVLVALCALLARKILLGRSQRAKDVLYESTPDKWIDTESHAHLVHQRSDNVLYASKKEAETPIVFNNSNTAAPNVFFPSMAHDYSMHQNEPYADCDAGMTISCGRYYTHPMHQREQQMMAQQNIRPVSVVSTENVAGVGLRGSSASYNPCLLPLKMPSEVLAERQRQSLIPSSATSFPSSISTASEADTSFDVNVHYARNSNASTMLALPLRDKRCDEGNSPLDPFIAQTHPPLHRLSSSHVTSHGRPFTLETGVTAGSYIDITSPPRSASPLPEQQQREASMPLSQMPLPDDRSVGFLASGMTPPMTATAGTMATQPPMSPRTAQGLRKLHLPDKVRSNSLSTGKDTREVASPPPALLSNPFNGGSEDEEQPISNHTHAFTEEVCSRPARSDGHEATFPFSPRTPASSPALCGERTGQRYSPSPRARDIALPPSVQGSISSMRDFDHHLRAPRSSMESTRDLALSKSVLTTTIGLPHLRGADREADDAPALPTSRA